MTGPDLRAGMVTVRTYDGDADAYLARPLDGASHPAVLLLMDALGLRPELYGKARRLASHGYVVLVPNLFYRSGPAPLVDDLPDLLRPENRAAMLERLRPFIESVTPELSTRDAGCFLDYLGALPGVASSSVGVVGYCFGGAAALRAAATYPERVAAVASFHGGNLATARLDSPHLLVGRIQAEVYIAHADHDASMPPEQIERLGTALDRVAVPHRSEVYAGARHGFTMSDTAAYDREAAERHWAELVSLFWRATTRH